MRKECKISLPFYKIAYAVFCADTYVAEIITKRSEVWRLYPPKKKLLAIYTRLFLQISFLFLLAAAGYGLFFLFQKPTLSANFNYEIAQFFVFLASILITIAFWGIWANTLACVFRNMWLAIGACLLLWIITNSSLGVRYLGKWNVFSYTFREINANGDFSWLCGKVVCILLGTAAVAAFPKMIAGNCETQLQLLK